MKKRIAILLIFTLIASTILSGCGKKATPAKTEGNDVENGTEEVVKVGLVV